MPDPPFAYHVPAPQPWSPELAGEPDTELDDELCIIRGEQFFVRARIQLPVTGGDEPFEWGVWVSLSEDDFKRMVDVWDIEGREAEPPYAGALATELPLYPLSTLALAAHIRTRPVGERPLVVLEPSSHQLAREQRDGITLERVQEIAERLAR
jgi:hypothetical protein